MLMDDMELEFISKAETPLDLPHRRHSHIYSGTIRTLITIFSIFNDEILHASASMENPVEEGNLGAQGEDGKRCKAPVSRNSALEDDGRHSRSPPSSDVLQGNHIMCPSEEPGAENTRPPQEKERGRCDTFNTALPDATWMDVDSENFGLEDGNFLEELAFMEKDLADAIACNTNHGDDDSTHLELKEKGLMLEEGEIEISQGQKCPVVLEEFIPEQNPLPAPVEHMQNNEMIRPIRAGEEDEVKQKTTADEKVTSRKKKPRTLSKEAKEKKKRKSRLQRAEKNRRLGVKRLKLPPMPESRPVKYCCNYLKGRCHKGAQCSFSHDTVPLTKSSPCCHFARRSCLKGEDCPYDHQLSKYQCNNFFTNGFCHRGDACMFSHKEDGLPGRRPTAMKTGTEPSLPAAAAAKKRGADDELFKFPTHVKPADPGGASTIFSEEMTKNTIPKGLPCRFLHGGASLESDDATSGNRPATAAAPLPQRCWSSSLHGEDESKGKSLASALAFAAKFDSAVSRPPSSASSDVNVSTLLDFIYRK